VGSPDAWSDRLLRELRPELERALGGSGEDGVALVIAGDGEARPEVLVRTRDAAVDELLELADRCKEPRLKRIAASLLGQPQPRPGTLWCVVIGPPGSVLRAISRPVSRPEDLDRARAAISRLCLDQRGLGAPGRGMFAIRAHSCNVCAAWAMVLEELGADLRAHTAPNAARAPVRQFGGTALCAGCVDDHRAVVALAREELGIDDEQAIAAAMPRAVLERLDPSRKRALRRQPQH
jgi:hypothetical protein